MKNKKQVTKSSILHDLGRDFLFIGMGVVGEAYFLCVKSICTNILCVAGIFLAFVSIILFEQSEYYKNKGE